MRMRNAQDCRCSYVVVVESAASSINDLRELGNYLSTLSVAGCDVVVLDPSPRKLFELNGRILRWVARHVPVRAEHCTPAGTLDRLRAAASVAACEKVIVASEDVRYTPGAIAHVVTKTAAPAAARNDFLYIGFLPLAPNDGALPMAVSVSQCYR